jgi:peptidoglycan LD-endopeptidase LytH
VNGWERSRGWFVVALAMSAASCAGRPAPDSRPAPVAGAGAAVLDERTYLRLRMLMVPVVGVRPEQVYDSFLEPRSGGRVHHAVDIMAPRGTPVLAADDGRVLRLRRNTLGGITIYAVDPMDRYVYYYAHLERYAHGLAEGQVVTKGQVIGYVGTTGDAPANLPHLHFQMMRRPNAVRWWDGPPIDPKPYLALPGRAGR